MRAILFAAAAGLCWGVGELATKAALHGGRIGPMTAIAVRSTIALPMLWLAWLATRLGWAGLPPDAARWEPLDRATALQIGLGSGLCAGTAAMIFFYLALSFGEIGRVKPISFALAPTTAVILGWMLLGEELSLRKVVAVLLIVGGVVLLTGR